MTRTTAPILTKASCLQCVSNTLTPTGIIKVVNCTSDIHVICVYSYQKYTFTPLPVVGGSCGLDGGISRSGSADGGIALFLSGATLLLADGLRHLAALEVGHVVRLQVLQVERLPIGQLLSMISST